MADNNSEAMSIRFLINTKNQRIVYAEAGKEFVDIVFSFLSEPICSALKLLYESESTRKIRSVSNLYHSMEKLRSQYMSTDKSQLLDPKFITTYSNDPLRIGGNYYVCPDISYDRSMSHNISTINTDTCICGNPVNSRVQLRQNTNVKQTSRSGKAADQGNRGYVKEMLTFMITDDLKITVCSTITSIMILNQLNIKDLSDLQERNAIVDRKKALEIVETSLDSTTVLNDVFGAQFSMPGKCCRRLSQNERIDVLRLVLQKLTVRQAEKKISVLEKKNL